MSFITFKPATAQIMTSNNHNITNHINQSMVDTLALMKRFEETGMDTVMKDDYLALYDIYNRLQEQKESIESTRATVKAKGSGLFYNVQPVLEANEPL